MAPRVTKKKTTWGTGGFFANRELGALALVVLTPILVFPFWYLCTNLQGDVFRLAVTPGLLGKIFAACQPSRQAVAVFFGYIAFELVLQRWMPGKTFRAEGAMTVSGHVPVYKANGVQSYLFSILVLFLLRYDAKTPQPYLGLDPALVYDMMGQLLYLSNLTALALCVFLTFKGLNFPSTKESGTTGSWILDFFWGTDLYPNILGWDVKQFTNCRFGMMFWQLGIFCYAFKSMDLHGSLSSGMLVSVALQTVYIAKFFWWETGYFQSMDIQHDRGGYYICWGCMVWVPSVYTMHTLFLVANPQLLSQPVAALYLAAGVFCIWSNYDADRQRQEFRQTRGECLVWGAKPSFIAAKYTTTDGEQRTSLLLTSGWWGISRHYHYIPEILASVFWCVPAQHQALAPYFYPFYLTLLLLDRSFRDDKRCADKYGPSWTLYCKAVEYKIIPGVV